MYLGIDLGTSGVKVVLMNEKQHILAVHTESLSISRPYPLWSEQDPDQWWQAANKAVLVLREQYDLQVVQAIGLTGQMHGATLLDNQQQVLRPAILWNDGRSQEQCIELERLVPASRLITGNLMMPGFTAPKLKWLQQYEPDIFAQIDKVLLPKDYLRFKMTGQFATDMSDAAGTMWLDVGQRNWSEQLLSACGLTRSQMPQLFEGNQVTGHLLAEVAQRWGMSSVPVVAGGGDNAAGAIGVGVYKQGQAMLSLGTSGVYFMVSDSFRCKPEQAIHSFCHALPERWHLMSVMLSAATCLDWACQILQISDVATLLQMAESVPESQTPVYFLPYLSGERTPHNNPHATGTFFGLTHQHQTSDMAKAVVLGVSFALADCMDVLHSTGVEPDSIILIGGGARSAYWRQLLSDVSGCPLEYRQGGEVGPALGAAKLAQLACQPERDVSQILTELPLQQKHEPNQQRYTHYLRLREKFRTLYQQLAPCMG